MSGRQMAQRDGIVVGLFIDIDFLNAVLVFSCIKVGLRLIFLPEKFTAIIVLFSFR